MKFFLFALFFVTYSMALSFYGNESEIKWKSADSKHFTYHYPAEYTSHAERVAATAEAVYDSVTKRYPNKLPRKVHLSLRNALFSNGYAIPAETSMNLWLSNWDFKIRSSHGWLSDVVTHEFSHLVSIEDGAKINPMLYGLQVSFTDYYNERTRTDFTTLIPFTLQPLWLAEGTAQFESERMGFDAWDSHRDMLLRTTVLADSLLPMSLMYSFSPNSLKAELGPYTQGFSLVRYIANTYGEDAVPKIWTALSKPYRATLNAAFEEVLGIGEDSLYNNWKSFLQKNYSALRDSITPLKEGEKITEGSFYQDYPTVAGNFIYGVSNFGGEWFDGSVFKMPKNLDSLMTEKESEDDIEISVSKTLNMSDFSKSGFKLKKAWVDKGISVRELNSKETLLAYVSYKNRNKNGRASFDIFVTDSSGHEKEVTHLLDAVYPDIHPNGKEVVFARRESNSTRFILSKATIKENESSDGTFTDIFVPEETFSYYNIYAPKFSPSGDKIVFSYFDDHTRGIAIIDADGKNFKILSDKNADYRDPVFIDENTIVYSADKNGIFNLYRADINNMTKEEPVTNVLGGAFTPAILGQEIIYTGYDKDGFSLYKIDLPKSKTDSTVFLKDVRWITQATIPFLKKNKTVFEDLFINRNESYTNTKNSPFTLSYSILNTEHSATFYPIEILKDSTYVFSQVLPTTLYRKRYSNNPEKVNILNDVSFAGSEKNYKPIPIIPLFVPLLSFEENAPAFSVTEDGDLLAKLGMALILSDPLKINTVQLGLLFEITNGFDYFNGDGLNPNKLYDFFAIWENKSTPFTFDLGYSYTNLTSKDTVHYENRRDYCSDDVKDCYGVSNYAISLQTVFGNAGYSIFKQGDTTNVTLAYDWANFNLYEDDFEWTYHKRLLAGLMLGYYGDFDDEHSIAGRGNGIGLAYTYANADLYRSGSFSETFVVSENGSIKPKYRNFKLHEIAFNAFASLSNPIHNGARLAFGASLSGILNWNSADSDTLDSFYNHPLLLEGYPYLISTENYNRGGTKTAVMQIHYIFPVLENFRHRFWIFETEDLYLDLFAQYGAAWSGKWGNFDKFKHRDFWDRSLGLEIRLTNNIFHSTPLYLSLSVARALDRIGEGANGAYGKKMTPIDLPLLPKAICPTRIHLTLGTAFNNIWQN